MSDADRTSKLLEKFSTRQEYQRLYWTGSFEDYLSIVRKRPEVTRNAYQRLFDMIASWGSEEASRFNKTWTRYKFFDDPIDAGKDAIFGMESSLEKLVNVLKSAALGFGTERRIILLHGPVGSAKSTIVRLLKKGLEAYSLREEGALYTYEWKDEDGEWVESPMREDPLKLIPEEIRPKLLSELLDGVETPYPVRVEGQLNPSCRYRFKMLMERYDGEWTKVLDHIRVKRLVLSEKDRVGIGTFQPKDEKNQDSTELTGDINYRKIAIYGSDSDPRAFNFDGEFNVANRGLIEFVEILKLDVAFLYDLLGATQEHKIKPKKFAQTDIDEVIIGHSVAGDTPIPYRFDGRPGWETLAGLEERFHADSSGLEVLAYDFEAAETRWTPVRRVFKHRFEGEMLTTSQRWGVVETTPNHSIYNREGEVFYPEDQHEVMAVRRFAEGFAAERLEALTVDVVEGVAGILSAGAKVTSTGSKLTRPPRAGWARLAKPRHATQIKAVYDVVTEAQALEDLLTVLIWYATEGHVNGRNGGLVVSQADKAELERVQAAYGRITTAKGSIDAGAKSDSAWRLYLSAEIIAAVAVHHCGELSENKRLPDFLFQLPERYLRHALNELIQTDGSRSLGQVAEVCTEAYRAEAWEYKTVSALLAAQVGTLATLLGQDYSVTASKTQTGKTAYRIRFVSSSPKRGGRKKSCEKRLERRPAAADEWVYDIECEGLHNFVCGVGNVVCHNTNEPEYRRLQTNELMEAFRDRTVKIDVPYLTTLDDEVAIYAKDYGTQRAGKHIAPHTLEVAAMWAVLTRLEEPKNHQLSVMQKLKLYNGKSLPGFTSDNVRELRESAEREGMEGISPRYIQDKLSNAIVGHPGVPTVNPFMVMNELEEGLRHHSLIASEDERKRYHELLSVVKEEYEDIIKNEVQKAISADEDAIARLCANYIDSIKAYTTREKVRNAYTGKEEEPDERLMRSIEEKIDVPESRKDDFRREIMNYIAALAIEGKQFRYWTNERLQKALELKLFEDQKDSIKLKNLVANVVDRETQEKIDIVKSRLIKNYGYDEHSATDILNYVASIYARGDVKQ